MKKIECQLSKRAIEEIRTLAEKLGLEFSTNELEDKFEVIIK